MKTYEIAVIPGDGIGNEVVPAALQVLRTLADVHGGLNFKFTSFPWNCDYYMANGKMMPDDGIDILKGFQAVFLGAIGDPKRVPDHISLWGLLIKIRREFEQSINIRPAAYFKGLESPLKHTKNFDLMVVRENSEGEYSEIGGRIHKGEDQLAIQNAIFSRRATERAMDYAFKLAQSRRGHVTSATKSNGIVHTMPFWDEVFEDVSKKYPDVQTAAYHIDALSAFFVTRPEIFDVVVSSNLFGDILSELGAAIMGSIGIAPAANINTKGNYPSMFEPVHGSAPDIYGRGIANPIAQIWTAKMMLDHFGDTDIAQKLLDILQDVTAEGVKTPDIGGRATTQEVTEAICNKLKDLA
ncbi:tartrate dehydrogenase [Alicyclobacillus fodiniaquatilis]|uniref:Tartrate dehydrogenase n=1 Tax=Alicyclobacillus fodiniaquatilis TaxID=1661150 RepID=A0ABW4JFJ6_9BACL